MDRTQDGRPLKLLTIIDEYTRECLAIAVRRRLRSQDVQEVLAELFLLRGCPTHIRSYDFVMDRTQDGRPLKLLTIVDEYTRECLAIAVRRRLRSQDVQEVLAELFLLRGCPTHIRSDNGPEFIARMLRQ